MLDSSSQTGLWYGGCRENQGWFPASHVRVSGQMKINKLVYFENNNKLLTRFLCQVVSGSASRPASTSLSNDSFPPAMRTQRANVVDELMNTERDYVRLLENIVQVSCGEVRSLLLSIS